MAVRWAALQVWLAVWSLAVLAHASSNKSHESLRGRPQHRAPHKSEHQTLRKHWTTAHSIAVLVPKVTVPFPEPSSEEKEAADIVDDSEEERSVEEQRSGAWDYLASPPVSGEPWWWLVAHPVGASDAKDGNGSAISSAIWDEMVEVFNHKLDETDLLLLEEGMLTLRDSGDDLEIRDPKVQTIEVGGVFFTARRMSLCQERTQPPAGSLMPLVLPAVPQGTCVLEICGLEANTTYRLQLFNISDGAAAPLKPIKARNIAKRSTRSGSMVADLAYPAIIVLIVLSVLVALATEYKTLSSTDASANEANNTAPANDAETDGEEVEAYRSQLRAVDNALRALEMDSGLPELKATLATEMDELKGKITSALATQRSNSISEREPLVNIERNASSTRLLRTASMQQQHARVGGFHQHVVVRDHLIEILKDVMWTMWIFLPLLGPLGIVAASHVLIGVRMNVIRTSYQRWRSFEDKPKENKKYLFDLVLQVVVLLMNICMLPINAFMIQIIYFKYGLFFRLELDQSSWATYQRGYNSWRQVSGFEFLGWMPGIVFSAIMLAVQRQQFFMHEKLRHHQKRLEDICRNSTQDGNELLDNLYAMEDTPFGRKGDFNIGIPLQLMCIALGLLFGFLPHIWMCVLHHTPFWDKEGFIWITIFFAVNIGGATARFFKTHSQIVNTYRNHCKQLSWFQALSWKEDSTMAIYDPFVVRNDAVCEARATLRESEYRIQPLKLEDPSDSKLWWHLREIMLAEMKEGRGKAEVMILISLALSLFGGIFSIVLFFDTGTATSTTGVCAGLMLATLVFLYKTLAYARDVNGMCKEHVSLLHNVVAEANMPLRPQRPLDSHLQQERFLLQLATLTERQDHPETIASFPITPQVFSFLIIVISSLLFGVLFCLWQGLVIQHRLGLGSLA